MFSFIETAVLRQFLTNRGVFVAICDRVVEICMAECDPWKAHLTFLSHSDMGECFILEILPEATDGSEAK